MAPGWTASFQHHEGFPSSSFAVVVTFRALPVALLPSPSAGFSRGRMHLRLTATKSSVNRPRMMLGKNQDFKCMNKHGC